MRIGELARAGEIPTRTVRFYERRGLLPEPRRAANGYRVYDEATVSRLRFIRTAQAAGLTLSEIRAIVEIRNDGTAPCTHVDALLVAKLADIERRRQELAALEADLTRLVDRSRMLDPADCTRGDICHILQPATIGRSKNPATGSGFGVGT
jgi:MerR family mercuric resistance operon transcriptional regulator